MEAYLPLTAAIANSDGIASCRAISRAVAFQISAEQVSSATISNTCVRIESNRNKYENRV